MYPDSVSGVHFLFPLIHRKSRFFSKFVNTYSGNKMGEHICFRRNERLATVVFLTGSIASVRGWVAC